MSFQIKSFATIRISVTDVAESQKWYESLFCQKPIEEIGGKIYRGPLGLMKFKEQSFKSKIHLATSSDLKLIFW